MSRRSPSTGRAVRPPLDAAALDALAIGYLGRYAITRAKLASYLRRKLAERGWAGEGEPPVAAVAERCAALGYVDDAAFAAARGAALGRRGYGVRRIARALQAAGVEDEAAAPARAVAEEDGWAAALRFARRRRIGPYGDAARPPEQRRRDLAALLRAGHDMDTACRIAFAREGDLPGEDDPLA